ncbi:MAG TPA: AraC family transcriptional regulator [Gemmatimonadaceae bacterium]|nr:AraC family transcriptional regulator [Gemmatimonadaceae bacterium]
MLFLAWLNAPFVTRLMRVVEATHQVRATSRREEFLDILRQEPVDVAVIDPSLGATDTRHGNASVALELLSAAPNASVIVYGYPVQRVVAELGAIARNHRTLFVVRDARDEIAQLRLAVTLATAADPSFELLARLQSSFARLPSLVARALTLALEHPEKVHRVADVAFAAGKSERTLNRYLDHVGLHSAGYFVTAANLLYAYRLLRQPRTRVNDVAERLDYASVNHFREAVRRSIGCSPRELRAMHADILAERIATWLSRTPNGMPAPSGPQWLLPSSEARG